MTGDMNTPYDPPPPSPDLLPKTDTVLALLRTQKDGKEHAETTAELGRIYARCLVRDAVLEEASRDLVLRSKEVRAEQIEVVASFLAGKVAEHGEAPIGYVEAAIHQLGYISFSAGTRAAYEALSASSRRAVNGKLVKLWRVEHLYPEWRAFLKGLT